MNPCAQVGITAANWNPYFSNWAQLENPCQLQSFKNQQLMPKLAKLAVGKAANLPTGANPHGYWVSGDSSVGENSPSYYVGEGTAVPSDLRGSVDADGSKARSTRLVVLALDLGTTAGWALRSRDGQIAHGFVNFKPQRFEGGGMRYLRFRRWLTELKQCCDGMDAVYFEEVRRHAGVDAAHAYGGFMAHLTAWCEHHQIPYQGVPVGTIKKHATGKGNASKAEMIAAAKRCGFEALDDNHADALALLDWAIVQGGESCE